MREGGGSVTAFVRTNAEGQSVLNYGIGKVLSLFVEFLCLGKMTCAKTEPTKCEVRAVLWFLMTKHYSVAAIH